MQSMPLISIIIPAYNGRRFIRNAIGSVFNQTYQKFEIIVVDDASTDDTCAIVEQWKDPRLQLIRNSRNIGLVANLNKGICESKGDLFCWLNQDDIFYPGKLEKQARVMVSNPAMGACFCQKEDIGEDGRLQKRFNPTIINIAEEDQLVQLFGGCYLSAPTVMMRRHVYHRLDGFDPLYTIAFDYDMWFKLKKNYKFKILNEPLLAFRHHCENLSSERNEPVIASECASIIQKNLKAYNISEIYPFLTHIEDPEQERIETSACLLSLAELIWRQKKWNLLLIPEIVFLVEKALSFNQILIEACDLGLEITISDSFADRRRLFETRKYDLCKRYFDLLNRLHTAFQAGNQSTVTELTKTLYAMCPLNGDPYYQLALLFYRTGNHLAASSYCASAIKLNCNHIQAKQLWAMLKTVQGATGPMGHF
jgi:glycosyltransferase involved in cell wall biosynthesis